MSDVEHGGEGIGLEPRLRRLEAALATMCAECAALRAELHAPKNAEASGRSIEAMPAHEMDAGVASAVTEFATATNDRKQTLENRIGSQWFARVGILALLLGVGWFLKLAIDNHWVHPTPMGKTIAGLLLGAGLVVWSERFRRKGYAAFSYSLKAVGTGVLYLTLWAAFHLFGLLPASVALVLMIAVTAWNATMAWLQDAELLAAYALLGGFLTPALLGSGGNHEVFLFTYLLAIDVAVLWLLTKKPWQRLLLGNFPATAVYFIAWYTQWFSAEQAGVTAMFVLLMSAPFVAVAMLGAQRDDVSEGVLTPLAAASFLSLAMYSVLEDSGRHGWLPWVAVGFAAIYLLLARMKRNGLAETVHTSVAVILLTVAIPLKASGRTLTVSWLAEGVALLWVAGWAAERVQRNVRRVLRWLGAAALALGMASAFVHSFDAETVVIWNARFATELCGVVAAMLGARFFERTQLDGQRNALTFFVAAHVLMVWAGVREIETFFLGARDAGLAEAFTISAWLMLYAAALLTVGFWKQVAAVRWQGLVLLVFTIAKVFVYDMRNLSSGYRVMSFMGLGALLLAVSFAYQRDWLSLREDEAVK